MAREIKEIEYCIEERIAILSENEKGVILAMNRVSFGDTPAKLDLRRWKDGKPWKGVSMSDDEARALLEALQGLFGDSGRQETEKNGRKDEDK